MELSMNEISKVVKLTILGSSIVITSSSIAANNDDCEFQDSVAGTYLTEECTLIPVSRAIAKYKSSAISGNAEAQYQLGKVYYSSTSEAGEAYNWLLSAARQGHVEAQTDVALLYMFGIGVEKSIEKSVYWYKKAAGNGSYKAIRNLNDLYEEGLIELE